MCSVLSFDIGVKNLAYCRATVRDRTIVIHDWRLLQLDSHSVSSITECLDAIPDLVDNVSTVLIEKQMQRNARMCFVAAAIEMYLHMRSQMEFGLISFIKMPAWARTQHSSGCKTSYRQRKKDSVGHATSIVGGTEWEELLKKAKKKDDLADCLCQIYAWSPFTSCHKTHMA